MKRKIDVTAFALRVVQLMDWARKRGIGAEIATLLQEKEATDAGA